METTLLVIIGFFVGFVMSRYVDLNFKGLKNNPFKPGEVK